MASFRHHEYVHCTQYIYNSGALYIQKKKNLITILFTKQGHIRLVDFGMCVGKMYREEFLPSNFCGTPEYMAPEVYFFSI